MFSEYIQAALRCAEYKSLEDGTYMATVEGLRGVIAIGDSIEECRQDLIGVIEGWIALRLKMGDAIPSIDGVSIDVSTEPTAAVRARFRLKTRADPKARESWISRDRIRDRGTPTWSRCLQRNEYM